MDWLNEYTDKSAFLEITSQHKGSEIWAADYDPAKAHAALSSQIIGQPEACKGMAYKVLRTNAGLKIGTWRGPAAVCFCTGPTGTGKTEMGKAVAGLIFGNEKAIVQIDANRLKSADASQLWGGFAGSYQAAESSSLLSGPAKKYPDGCVVLIDEAEKMAPTAWEGLMELLDTGYIVHGPTGEKVDLRRCVFIMTTNAEPQRFAAILDDAEFTDADKEKKARDLLTTVVGRPEIAARVRHILVFRPLGSEALGAISVKQIVEQMRDRYGIEVERGGLDPHLVGQVYAHSCKLADYGARMVGAHVSGILADKMPDIIREHQGRGETIKRARVMLGEDGGLDVIPTVTESQAGVTRPKSESFRL